MSSKTLFIKTGRAIKTVVLFLLFIIVTLALIGLIFQYTFERGRSIVFGVIGIWAVISYITIPRIHRRLSKIYVPNYYIGRTRTADGLLGDPVNVAFIGSKRDVLTAMKNAGWILADELDKRSTLNMIKSTILRKSYPNAPVSSLFLFDQQQDFAFQQEVGGTTSKRHHIRFWKCPPGWYLPGGYSADWLAAASYDRRVGLSTLTFQITHKIEADIDTERDFVIGTLKDHNKNVRITVVKKYSTAYHSRNGGGDRIKTDGSLPFVTIK